MQWATLPVVRFNVKDDLQAADLAARGVSAGRWVISPHERAPGPVHRRGPPLLHRLPQRSAAPQARHRPGRAPQCRW
ncbi:hypothetical protein BN10_130049 [Phycicoccus elongatus Lp2]|uniref:Uncharacterized protein n=1 Tax=Phycicoccus elongatus Lp2 TaxID=1193181 RepID=N0E032_9MICO|nr:hypothetical protein BN10_130049 [Phycicoccus elongatus Lp2]